jgi:hypothetical protein
LGLDKKLFRLIHCLGPTTQSLFSKLVIPAEFAGIQTMHTDTRFPGGEAKSKNIWQIRATYQGDSAEADDLEASG